MRNRICLAAFAPLCFVFATSVEADGPPMARREMSLETVHGVEIRDPYRWMEYGGPEFDQLARAEDAYARGMLAGLPERAALLTRVRSLLGQAPFAGSPQRGGNRLLLTTYRVGDSTATLTIQETTAGAPPRERTLPDLARLHARDGRHSTVPHSLVLSPDGRYLSVGLVRDGEADPVLRVYDIDRAKYLPEIVRWPLFADSRGFRPRWLADSSGFYYVRNPQRRADTPDVEREWHGRVFLHRLGEPLERDVALFGTGLDDQIAPDDTLYVEGAADPEWLFIYNRRVNGRELWAAPLARDGRPQAAFRRILAAGSPFAGWGRRGATLYALTPEGSSDMRLVAVDLDQPGSPLREVLASGDRPWSGIAVAPDAVYLVRRDGGAMSLQRLGEDAALQAIALPAVGEITALQPRAEGGVEFSLETWLANPQWLRVPAGALQAADTGLMPPLAVDSTAYVAERVLAEARDGALVPVTLLRRRDLPRDGRAKVLLHAYGCFGSSQDPEFLPEFFAWLDRGGIYAVAHVRGGGDLGTAWHLAGRDRNKPTAIADIIDSAAHLVHGGWTSPGRIAAEGASCGGGTVGRAVLERPDLFAAAVLQVGVMDITRGGDASYRRSIFDYGDPDTTEGARRIKQLSPYHAIVPGGRAPAFLLVNGANDYTIPLWQGAKFVARVRAESSGSQPALLRVDWTGGHNIASGGSDEYAQELADTFAFLLWRLAAADPPRAAR